MNQTLEPHIGIDTSGRKTIATGLGRLLADTYTLYLKTHGYHWNVTGPHFTALHNLFETQYNELWIAVDDVAERIRTLGHKTPVGYHAFSERTSIKDDAEVPAWKDMIANLAAGHETVVQTIREIRSTAEQADDESTLALLDDRRSVHEKTAWMLRAHLE